MLICGRCSAPVPPVATFCPTCGVRLATPVPGHTMSKARSCFLWAIRLLAFLLVCFLVLVSLGVGYALSRPPLTLQRACGPEGGQSPPVQDSHTVTAGPQTTIRAGTRNDSGVVATLPEGERVRVLTYSCNMVEVERSNCQRGWAPIKSFPGLQQVAVCPPLWWPW